MRRITVIPFALASLVLVLAGCSSKSESAACPVGTWEANASDVQKERAAENGSEYSGKLIWKFTKDGTASMEMKDYVWKTENRVRKANSVAKGTYSVKGNEIEYTLTEASGKFTENGEAVSSEQKAEIEESMKTSGTAAFECKGDKFIFDDVTMSRG